MATNEFGVACWSESGRTGHGVLILIDEVLRDVLHHELIRLLRHPGVDKGCKVEGWVAVEGQLIADQLIGCLRIYALCITVDEELRKDVSGV